MHLQLIDLDEPDTRDLRWLPVRPDPGMHRRADCFHVRGHELARDQIGPGELEVPAPLLHDALVYGLVYRGDVDPAQHFRGVLRFDARPDAQRSSGCDRGCRCACE